MNKFFLIAFFTIYSSVIFAAVDGERDVELLSGKIVSYFKKVALDIEKPIYLKITLSDAYGAGTSIEDEKELSSTSFPSSVSRSYVMHILTTDMEELVNAFIEDKDLSSLSLKATIWISDSNHREKANGFCSLGSR